MNTNTADLDIFDRRVVSIGERAAYSDYHFMTLDCGHIILPAGPCEIGDAFDCQECRREANAQLTLTLPKLQWKVISFLTNRGAVEQFDAYINGKQTHGKHCLDDFAKAALALQDLLRTAEEEAEPVL